MDFKESEKLEIKSSFSEWKEAIITLCAFANKKGGRIIIGMDDNGQPLGKTFGKGAIEDFANKIKNNTDPILYPSINVQTFGLGDIVEIIVEESDNKPVFANSIVHRDYADSGNVQIRIFDDRIEIWSPGLLPKEIIIAEIYKEARSVPRNKLIMRIFHECGLIENWGTGFQWMLSLCRANNNPDPEFSNRSEAFVISFSKRKMEAMEKSSEKSSEKILDLIKDNTEISAEDIANIIGISSRAVEKNIARLKQEGVLKRIGPDKGGYWKINL